MTTQTERDELIAAIYKARWVDGIKDITVATDAAIADTIIAAGFGKKEAK